MSVQSLRDLFRLVKTVRNWPIYILQVLGVPDSETIYSLRSGLKIRVREGRSDRGAFHDVWLDRSYDPNAFGLSFDWASARMIVDVGGNIGAFTLYAAAKSPDAKILALEPEQQNLRVLQSNIERNDLQKRVTALSLGIGDGTPVTLYTFEADQGGNSVYRTKEGGTPVMIQTVSLGTLFAKNGIAVCDYLKLDCEGAEYEALYATSDEDLRKIRCMGIEYHHFSDDPTHCSEYLEEFLSKRGFRVVRHRKSMLLAIREGEDSVSSTAASASSTMRRSGG